MNREILHIILFSGQSRKNVENFISPEKRSDRKRMRRPNGKREQTENKLLLIWIYSSKKLTNYFTDFTSGCIVHIAYLQ